MGLRYAFAAVPVIGVLELGAHLKQTHSVATDVEWRAARAAVEREVKPSDLVIFAPEWAEPLGREFFGSTLASISRIARPDESRFPRAIEVSIHGARRSELAEWKTVRLERVGPFEVATLENPAPSPIVDDLVEHVRPEELTVSQVDGDHEVQCPWIHGGVLTGGLGFGPSAPAERFACSGSGWVAVTVISDPTYRPRRCIYAPPLGGRGVLRLRFRSVAFGRTLRGHHAIPAEADHADGAPVTVVFRTATEVLGQFTRRDGSGWTPFESGTEDLAGKTGELIVDISAARADRRQYCFEVSTR